MPDESARSIQNRKNKININFVAFVLFVVNHCFFPLNPPDPSGEIPPGPPFSKGGGMVGGPFEEGGVCF
jgi:hypothetical protein